MPYSDSIRDAYFEWMYELVSVDQYYDDHSNLTSYRKLLTQLHSTRFRYSISNDANRAEDGLDLRYRFAYDHSDIEDAESYLRGPCSVLEMIVALALRMEESIMDDPSKGNRIGQWFWQMMVNLGLGSMVDERFDELYVRETIDCFLDRQYAPNGKGGLFTVHGRNRDLRNVEIWCQMCWYLDSIT